MENEFDRRQKEKIKTLIRDNGNNLSMNKIIRQMDIHELSVKNYITEMLLDGEIFEQSVKFCFGVL